MATPAINIDTLFNIKLLTLATPANPPEIILPTVLVIPEKTIRENVTLLGVANLPF